MKAPTTLVTHSTLDATAKEAESKLIQLQARGELALHMVEHPNWAVYFNPAAWASLGAIPASNIDASFQSGAPQLQSLSVLPHSASGIGMRPYGVKPKGLNNYGYFISLSQEHPYPPRVARVWHNGLNSGDEVGNKDFRMDRFGECTTMRYADIEEQLDQFYRRITGFTGKLCRHDDSKPDKETLRAFFKPWRDGIIAAMGGPDAAAHTKEQLNWLQANYQQGSPYFREMTETADSMPSFYGNLGARVRSGIVEYNEALTAMAREHIAAIMVPSYNFDSPKPQPFEDARAQLQASLVGLKHHSANITHLPTVIYHVDGEQRGKIEYVGKTKRELEIAGLTALKTIGKNPKFLTLLRDTHYPNEANRDAPRDIENAVREELNIDISTSPRGHGGWLADVNARLTSLTNPEHKRS